MIEHDSRDLGHGLGESCSLGSLARLSTLLTILKIYLCVVLGISC